MEIKQIQYFSTVAKHGNISGAAKELHVSQPSLSMTISRLEEDLGVKLFDRIGGKIHLNHMGESLLGNANRIIHELNQMYLKAQEQDDAAFHEIAFGITTAGIAMNLINAYLLQHPPLAIRHFFQNQDRLSEGLEKGQLDFAITKGKLDGANLQWTPLIEDEMMALVNLQHPLASKDSVYVSELLDYAFVLNHTDLAQDGDFARLFKGYDRLPDIQMISQEAAVTMEIVHRGLGVGLISSTLIQCDPRSMLYNEMKPLHIIGADTSSIIGVSRLKGRYLSSRAQEFYEFTEEFFRSLADA